MVVTVTVASTPTGVRMLAPNPCREVKVSLVGGACCRNRDRLAGEKRDRVERGQLPMCSAFKGRWIRVSNQI